MAYKYSESNAKSRLKNLEGYIFTYSKSSAKNRNIEFNISKKDIVLNKVCPIMFKDIL